MAGACLPAMAALSLVWSVAYESNACKLILILGCFCMYCWLKAASTVLLAPVLKASQKSTVYCLLGSSTVGSCPLLPLVGDAVEPPPQAESTTIGISRQAEITMLMRNREERINYLSSYE